MQIDIKLKKILSLMALNAAAEDEAIIKFQREYQIQLPEDYVRFLKLSNGAEGFVGNSYLTLYSIEELVDLNTGYRIAESSPGLVLFGSDGGEMGYLLNYREPTTTIVEISFIDLGFDEAKIICNSFTDFLEYLSRL